MNPNTCGGSFLIAAQTPAEVFTPEDLTPEHHAIARTARELFDKEVEPNVDAIQHGDLDLSVRVLRKAAELGLEAVLTPERYGGMEMDLTSALIVAEQLARDGSFAGWHGAHAGIGTLPLLLFGTEAQKQKYLPRLATCELVASYCLTEPHAGSDALAAKTRADLSADGTHYVLNGQKMWITNAGVADWYFVVAVTDPAKLARGGMTAFVVERGSPGVHVGKKEYNMGQRCSDTRGLSFEDVEVPEENLVGQIGDGWKLAMAAFDYTRPAVSCAAVGVARAAMEHAIDYALERKTFGQPIANHQAIQFMLAEMATEIDAARLLCWKAAWMKDNHLRNTKESSMAKAFAADVVMKTTTNAVQIFGGYGYSEEYPVEKLMRDAKIFQIYEGTSQIQRLIIAREMMTRGK
jgi:acyl-CoA dehydrogenase